MVSKQVLSILLISMAAIVMVTFLSSDSVSFFKKAKKTHFATAGDAAPVVVTVDEAKLTTAYTTELTTPCETACPAVNAAKTADSVKANADCKTACADKVKGTVPVWVKLAKACIVNCKAAQDVSITELKKQILTLKTQCYVDQQKAVGEAYDAAGSILTIGLVFLGIIFMML